VDYTRNEEGYPFARFRHPKEAELYVEKNFGEELHERREQEVDLLCRMIAACHWNEDEAYDVIGLIRCFGPNSEGKYSQDVTHGSYTDYISYLPKIADCLMEYADDNPEAVLVYAHFLRETYSNNQQFGQDNTREYLSEAKNKLRIAIERHDQQNLQQYNRLVVEMCANLVASMSWRNIDDLFDRDVFREFQNTFKLAIKTWDSNHTNFFTTNFLLDIWLNAIINFYNSFATSNDAMEDKEFPQALSDSLDYIDLLFEIDADFRSTNLLDKIDRIYNWTSTHSIEKISERFEAQGNDTFLYLTACRCWLSVSCTNSCTNLACVANAEDIILHNLFLLPDDVDSHAELSGNISKLRAEASKAAEKAVKILEGNMELIQRSQSSRCLHMLIRAKWLLYTGRMPLEEKQQPALTKNQWKEIYQLCSDYTRYCALNDLPTQNLESLFQAVYLWSFTSDVGQARTIFSQLRQQMGSNWFVERIGLCVPGQNKLRTFYVDVERISSGNYNAKISQEITSEKTSAMIDLRGRFGIHISDYMFSYLFDGQPPHNRYNICKPVVLWFTAKGPILGIAPCEKEGATR